MREKTLYTITYLNEKNELLKTLVLGNPEGKIHKEISIDFYLQYEEVTVGKYELECKKRDCFDIDFVSFENAINYKEEAESFEDTMDEIQAQA